MNQDNLSRAYEQFLVDGDESAFEEAITKFGGSAPSVELDFPIAHRIRDVMVCGAWYRIVRHYDTNIGYSRMLVYRTSVPSPQPGVPYELTGDALHRWVMDELMEPTEQDTDWSMYLDTMGNGSQQNAAPDAGRTSPRGDT